MSSAHNKWVERTKPNPFAKIRLFCFPYAGGGSSIYSQWSRHLPREVEKIAAVLPGREMRLSEKPFRDVRLLAQGLADGLDPYFDKPFTFFGHSMGALISFELCRELRRRGKPLPAKIFVGGHRAPQLPDREAPFFDLPDDQFIEKIRNLEGTPQGVLENEELMAFFVPILKADMTLCDTYEYRDEAPLSCPILVLGGYKDEQAVQTELIAWRSQTSAGFRVQMFSGGHFFIHDVRDQILQLLSHELTELMRST